MPLTQARADFLQEAMEIICENCEESSFTTLSCFHSFCKKCLDTSCSEDEVLHKCLVCGLTTRVDTNGVQNLLVGQNNTCSDHDYTPLSMYCETCQKLICIKCPTNHHQGHQYRPYRKGLPEYKDEVKQIVEAISKVIAGVSQAASQQKSLLSDSERNIAVAKTYLSSTMDVLHSILDVRKDALMYQLEDTSEEMLKDLKLSCTNLSCLLVKLNGYFSCLEKNLAVCSEVELLSMRKSIIQQASRLQNACKISLKEMVSENDCFIHAVFQPGNMSEILSTFGRVEVSHVKFEDSSEHKPMFLEPTLSLQLSLERHSSPLFTLAKLKSPTSVAISQKGEILVVESRGDQISFFSPMSGEKIYSFGICGSSEGEFSFPSSIAIDDRGDVLLVDGCNNRIQKYSSQGKFLAEAGCRGKGQLQFSEPEGLAINPVSKKIYVVDNNSHRIQVLNEDLTFDLAFGSKGLQDGDLYYPWGITCSTEGDVYITDSGSCCVKVFTSNGQFLREFGSGGDIEGCLKWPTGICLAKNGVVYVSDYGNHRIAVFTTEGKFLRCFGSRGTSWDEFGNVRGLAIDKNGVLYVCDTDNNRVTLY